MARISSLILSSCVAALSLAAGSALSAQEELLFDRFGFQLASQAPFLEDAKIPRRYAPENLFDGRAETSWAIGDGGPGKVLYVGIPSGAKELRVVNGYATNKDLFAKNNRVRRLKVSLCVAYSFPNRVTELGQLFTLDVIGFHRTLELADLISPQALALGIDWDRADELRRESETRFQEGKAALSDYELEAYAKGTIEEYVLRLEIVDLYRGSKWNDTCLSELSFSPETRSIPPEERLVGLWACVRGADFEELQLDADGYACSNSGGRPWASGAWGIEEGCLKISWDGYPEESIYGTWILEGGILTLIGTSGAVEVYEGDASGAP
jgi:hypothetical protein